MHTQITYVVGTQRNISLWVLKRPYAVVTQKKQSDQGLHCLQFQLYVSHTLSLKIFCQFQDKKRSAIHIFMINKVFANIVRQGFSYHSEFWTGSLLNFGNMKICIKM